MIGMQSAISSASLNGVRLVTSTTSGMIDRKNTITFGLPSVSDSDPRKARKPREAGGGASPLVAGAVAVRQAR